MQNVPGVSMKQAAQSCHAPIRQPYRVKILVERDKRWAVSWHALLYECCGLSPVIQHPNGWLSEALMRPLLQGDCRQRDFLHRLEQMNVGTAHRQLWSVALDAHEQA